MALLAAEIDQLVAFLAAGVDQGQVVALLLYVFSLVVCIECLVAQAEPLLEFARQNLIIYLILNFMTFKISEMAGELF